MGCESALHFSSEFPCDLFAFLQCNCSMSLLFYLLFYHSRNRLRVTLGARGFFSLGVTELSGEVESRSGEKKASGTNGKQPHFHADADFL